MMINDCEDPMHLLTLDATPILRQQRNWVGGVKKVAIFTDVQYYLC